MKDNEMNRQQGQQDMDDNQKVHGERLNDQRMPSDSNAEHQNMSATRGGTTDMDDESQTVSRAVSQQRGSGITTKRNVTGSDFDGQLSS